MGSPAVWDGLRLLLRIGRGGIRRVQGRDADTAAQGIVPGVGPRTTIARLQHARSSPGRRLHRRRHRRHRSVLAVRRRHVGRAHLGPSHDRGILRPAPARARTGRVLCGRCRAPRQREQQRPTQAPRPKTRHQPPAFSSFTATSVAHPSAGVTRPAATIAVHATALTGDHLAGPAGRTAFVVCRQTGV